MKKMILVSMLITLFTSPNLLAKNPFHLGFIDVEINLQENGDMLVRETQQYVFDEPYSDLRYRWISLEGIDSIADITVTDDGKPLNIKTNIENNQQWVEWTKPVEPPAQHTFVLSYRVIGGLAVKDAGDELDWQVIFKNLDVPINKTQVRVKVPASLIGHIQSYKGATAKKPDDQTIEFIQPDPLLASKGMEVSVTFTHGILNVQKSKKTVSDWWESEPASQAGWVVRPEAVSSSSDGDFSLRLRWLLLILISGVLTKHFVGKERLKLKHKVNQRSSDGGC